MGKLPFEKYESKILVRLEEQSNPKYGKSPEDRTIAELIERGIINIDKPSGPSSHQVSAYAKQIMKAEKTGHSGTLDPKVTGCLPVALNKGTRIVQSLLTAGKEYVCLMHLHKEVSKEELLKVFEEFTGKIKQLPPVKSAIKRQWRYRKVYYLELVEVQGQEVLFVAGTEAGTYIRKLCHDIGQKLGVGAHMAELRRTKAGPFKEDSLVTLQALSDAYYYHEKGDDSKLKQIIMPIESGVAHLKKVWVFDSAIEALCEGQTLKVPGISKLETEIQASDMVAVMSLKQELVMVGESLMTSKQMHQGTKGIAVRPKQVFMNSSIYKGINKVYKKN